MLDSFRCRMIGDIGLKFAESIPEIVPVLIPVLKDDTPAVARQAIRCGMEIFRYVLFKVALQVNWNCMGTPLSLDICPLLVEDLDLVNFFAVL